MTPERRAFPPPSPTAPAPSRGLDPFALPVEVPGQARDAVGNGRIP